MVFMAETEKPITIGKYLNAYFIGYSISGKTKRWGIKSISNEELGTVSWMAHWRKYSFTPLENTTYEEVCMRDIADFLDVHTKQIRYNKSLRITKSGGMKNGQKRKN